jgi:hypothetical protein
MEIPRSLRWLRGKYLSAIKSGEAKTTRSLASLSCRGTGRNRLSTAASRIINWACLACLNNFFKVAAKSES